MKVLSGIELKKAISELNILEGGIFNKAYQLHSKNLLLNIHTTKDNYILKIESGIGLFLTKYKQKIPQTPPHFCSLLRKTLNRAKIKKLIILELKELLK